MEGYIAEIRMFAGNFAPRGWAFCQGQILAIASNTALFSLLGTTYGGNGQTTFALPDFRGRTAVGTGQGPGLAAYTLGEVAGTETNTLIVTNMPAHSHAVTGTGTPPCHTGAGNSDSPAGCIPAGSASDENYIAAGSANGNMATLPVTGITNVVGNNAPVNNMQPFLGMNYIICISGIFPSRN